MLRKLRMGMIGGGKDAFIGAVHRIAANMDGEIELVCGAFSSDAAKSKLSGEQFFLAPERVYNNYTDMIMAEKQLPENERMDFVSIVTPNHLHFEPAKMAMQNGFDVIVDKPVTYSLEEAKELQKIVEGSGRLFCLTHTYTGYPMIKEARNIVSSGKIGKVRKVHVGYPQGWLSTLLEASGQKQAEWRTDPARSGIAGCMGDIGTHAFNLAEYVSGLSVTKLCADINVIVPGRKLDDDGNVLLKFDNGASGFLHASQVAAGEENNIYINVYGETGGLHWKQEDANSLILKWPDRPSEIYRTGTGYLSAHATNNTRVPAGHPEGYLEAFANIYRNFAAAINARKNHDIEQSDFKDFPGITEGLRGMAFIENVIASGKSNEKWKEFIV